MNLQSFVNSPVILGYVSSGFLGHQPAYFVLKSGNNNNDLHINIIRTKPHSLPAEKQAVTGNIQFCQDTWDKNKMKDKILLGENFQL